MSSPELSSATRRSARLLAWAALPVIAFAGIVQVTGVGIDILVVAAAALVLLALERSVGDWLGEWLGPLAAAAIFVAAAVALSWYFLSSALGRPQTDRFFVEAERRGYQTLYYETPTSRADASPPSADSSSSAQPVATGGGVAGLTSSSGGGVPSDGRAETAPRDSAVQPDAPPATPEDGASAASKDSRRRGSIRSFFRRNIPEAERIVTSVSVSVSPATVQAAHRAVISASVYAGGAPVTEGTVDFTVNGQGAGRIQLNARGFASTTFRTYIPGTYEIRARYSGSPDHASSRSDSVLLNVTARP